MDAAPQQADMSRAGVTGMRSVAKHTILANPKETAILIAILVVIIVVIGYMLYKKRKEGYATNFMTGGNQNQAQAMGGSQLSHTGSGDGRSSTMITWTDVNGVKHTAQEAQSAPYNADGSLAGTTIAGIDDLRSVGLIGADTNSVTDFTDLLPKAGSSQKAIKALDAKLGSMCASASAQALSEHQAQKALNGGLSGGAATPQ